MNSTDPLGWLINWVRQPGEEDQEVLLDISKREQILIYKGLCSLPAKCTYSPCIWNTKTRDSIVYAQYASYQWTGLGNHVQVYGLKADHFLGMGWRSYRSSYYTALFTVLTVPPWVHQEEEKLCAHDGT